MVPTSGAGLSLWVLPGKGSYYICKMYSHGMHRTFNANRTCTDTLQEILLSTVLGGAYALFNMKHHVWIPLVSEISSTQD